MPVFVNGPLALPAPDMNRVVPSGTSMLEPVPIVHVPEALAPVPVRRIPLIVRASAPRLLRISSVAPPATVVPEAVLPGDALYPVSKSVPALTAVAPV